MNLPTIFSLPALFALIIGGFLIALLLKRNGTSTLRICATLRKESILPMLAAIMLALSGLVTFLLIKLSEATEPALSLFTVALLCAAGALVFFSKKSKWLPPVAAFVVMLAVWAFYDSMLASVGRTLAFGIAGSLVFWPSLFLFLSALGWRRNVVFKWLPPRLAMPALNLLSAALTLLCFPHVARLFEPFIEITKDTTPLVSYLSLFVTLLPLCSILLLNLASEAQPLPRKVLPEASSCSIPRVGLPFVLASWLLMVLGAFYMLRQMLAFYSPDAWLLCLPLVVAGILLLRYKGHKKQFIAASACLLLSVAPAFLHLESYFTVNFWVRSFPILLMFLSAIGARWNTAPPFLSKLTLAPVLNVLAAALLLISFVLRVVDLAAYDSLAMLARALWYELLPSALYVAGLVLLNLSLGSYEAKHRGAFAAFVQLFLRVFGWVHRDVGGKIQVLAKVQTAIAAVLACLSALPMALGLCGYLVNHFFFTSDADFIMLFLFGLSGMALAFVLAISTWLLYAFGQMTADLHAIKERHNDAPTFVENPDDLPEL